MTDNDIKKALEWNASKFPAAGFVYMDAESTKLINTKNVVDLINRLEAENKKFKDRQKPTGASGYKNENGKVVFFTNMLGGCRYEYKDLDEVVKTLNELLHEAYSKDEIAFALKCKTEELETAKAEAYKEFAERVKEEDFDRCIDVVYDGSGEVKRTEIRQTLFNKQIDNLLKEMVGE